MAYTGFFQAGDGDQHASEFSPTGVRMLILGVFMWRRGPSDETPSPDGDRGLAADREGLA